MGGGSCEPPLLRSSTAARWVGGGDPEGVRFHSPGLSRALRGATLGSGAIPCRTLKGFYKNLPQIAPSATHGRISCCCPRQWLKSGGIIAGVGCRTPSGFRMQRALEPRVAPRNARLNPGLWNQTPSGSPPPDHAEGSNSSYGVGADPTLRSRRAGQKRGLRTSATQALLATLRAPDFGLTPSTQGVSPGNGRGEEWEVILARALR